MLSILTRCSDAVTKVESHVKDAVAHGGVVTTGGGRLKNVLNDGEESVLPGHFCAPTVVTNCTRDMLAFRDETFGPAAYVVQHHVTPFRVL
jgi:succinate-semialdehyde dehydrogenase/glutarate-semialdehyde dehydrogenase